MRMDRVERPCPCPGRDPEGGEDSREPLDDHQSGEQTVGAPVDDLPVFLEKLRGARLDRGLNGRGVARRRHARASQPPLEPGGGPGSRREQPKTYVSARPAVPVVRTETIASRPG